MQYLSLTGRLKPYRKKKKGMWMGGHPPLGYDLRERKLHVNRKEAEQVNRIFELYLELGCVYRLQRKLEEENITSKKWTSASGVFYGSKEFSRGAIYSILKNPTYVCEVHHKGKSYEREQKEIGLFFLLALRLPETTLLPPFS